MSRLPMISGDDFVRAVKKIGYEEDHMTGSRMILRHTSRRGLTVRCPRAAERTGFMTADWARLPGACPERSRRDLLARIANRIVNEVPAVTAWCTI